MNIVNAFRSEWILLNRKRLWLILGVITTVYTAVATTLVINTAEPLLQQSGDALALEALLGAGGATMAVIFSIAFASCSSSSCSPPAPATSSPGARCGRR